ncbi:hypothetical protein [Ralstonia pseudosolanacearum]|uniref:hypothetical protein n=1 Tax=Ralstonia pseudosolanacearum TaxID=1310165 RepID=UPI003AAE5ED7
MSRTAASYGRRGRLSAANTGIRQTASTYGKARFGTYSEKAGGHINVESDAERFVAQLLTIDPRVRAFQPQPFCVDLIDQRVLFTRDAVREAWRKHRNVPGAKFYTVDFSIEWLDGFPHAVEVKAEGFEGDEVYWDKVARARPIPAANGYPLRTLVLRSNTVHPVRMNSRVLKQAAYQARAYLTDELVERVMQRCEEGSVSVRTLFHDDIYAGKRTLLRAGKPRSSHAAQREEKALHERTRH